MLSKIGYCFFLILFLFVNMFAKTPEEKGWSAWAPVEGYPKILFSIRYDSLMNTGHDIFAIDTDFQDQEFRKCYYNLTFLITYSPTDPSKFYNVNFLFLVSDASTTQEEINSLLANPKCRLTYDRISACVWGGAKDVRDSLDINATVHHMEGYEYPYISGGYRDSVTRFFEIYPITSICVGSPSKVWVSQVYFENISNTAIKRNWTKQPLMSVSSPNKITDILGRLLENPGHSIIIKNNKMIFQIEKQQ